MKGEETPIARGENTEMKPTAAESLFYWLLKLCYYVHFFKGHNNAD